MTAELNVYAAAMLTIDGVPFPDYGSLRAEIKTVELTYGANPILKPVKVPAGEMVNAWSYADNEGFQLVACHVIGGEGFLQFGVRYSNATSADDLTPTGTNPVWKEHSMSCFESVMRGSKRAYTDTVAANNSSETDDFPTLWAASGTKTLAVADRVAFFNEGEDDVVVMLLVVPE